MAKPTDLPTAEKLKHGTRARYVTGCRCPKCTKANTDSYHERVKREKEAALDREILPPVPRRRTWKGPNGETRTSIHYNGCPGINGKPCVTESTIRKDSTGGICGGCRGKLVWNGLVNAKKTRVHLRKLSQNGVGRRAVQAASDVSGSVLSEIISGEKQQVRASTEKAILGVDLSCASDGANVIADSVWKMIEWMTSTGLTKGEIARRLGSKAKVPALQLGRYKISVKKAAQVTKLYNKMREGAGLGEIDIENLPLIPIEICTQCGHSHKPRNRQKLIARMVREGLPAREIKEEWSCFYPHVVVNDPADRRLFRDIAAIKKKEK